MVSGGHHSSMTLVHVVVTVGQRYMLLHASRRCWLDIGFQSFWNVYISDDFCQLYRVGCEHSISAKWFQRRQRSIGKCSAIVFPLPFIMCRVANGINFYSQVVTSLIRIVLTSQATGHVSPGVCACTSIWQFLFTLSPVGSGSTVVNTTYFPFQPQIHSRCCVYL